MRSASLVLPFAMLVAVAATGCSQPAAVPERPAAVRQPPAVVEKAVDETQQTAKLDELLAALANAKDSEASALALDNIALLGPNAQAAIDDLVKATTSDDPRVRWHAARAIGLVGEDAIAQLPVLAGLLGDSDPVVVAQAAAAIGLIRKDDDRTETPPKDAALYESVFVPLSKTALHPDARARRAAIRALKTLAPSPAKLLPIFSQQIADSDPSVVLPALHTLADMGKDAVPVLLEALKKEKSRYWASVALAEIGPAAAPAVEPLAVLASEGEIDERLQAILALASIGEPAKAAGPALLEALACNEEMLQFAAAFAVGKLRLPEADEPLKKTAGSTNEFLASVAAWARAQINPADKAVVADAAARLEKLLASDKPSVRCSSVSGLSDLSAVLDAKAQDGLAQSFAGLIADADPDVAVAAGAALVRLGAPAVAPLREKLADPAARVAALEILGTIGGPAKPALPDMIKALADPDEAYRSDAAVAIAGFGADAADAAPELSKLLESATAAPGTRYAAAYALGRIGPAARPALDKLRELAAAEDELLATVAIWAALKIDPADSSLFASAVPRLRKALRSGDEIVRLEAAVALGDIGPDAKPALPILELVAEDDPLSSVREAAEQAIAKISAANATPASP